MSARETILALVNSMNTSVIGQARVVERMVIGLLADGHVLIEGMPGLAKTRAVKAMARALTADFTRIQFTPDLLPSDVTGADVYYSKDGAGEFRFQPGPVFGNILLADEINRAPAKVQAALLEAMEERQVTVGGASHPLPSPFMVLATQNPIEQEGTYPLPEAQLDRFLMHILITYPPVENEIDVVRLVRGEEREAAVGVKDKNAAKTSAAIPQEAIFKARHEIAGVHVSDAMDRYIADLVNASRFPASFGENLPRWIEMGASPRASLALDKCGRAHAWLNERDYVDPQDIRAIAPEVFRHRLGLSFEAQGDAVTPDHVVDELLKQVALT